MNNTILEKDEKLSSLESEIKELKRKLAAQEIETKNLESIRKHKNFIYTFRHIYSKLTFISRAYTNCIITRQNYIISLFFVSFAYTLLMNI